MPHRPIDYPAYAQGYGRQATINYPYFAPKYRSFEGQAAINISTLQLFNSSTHQHKNIKSNSIIT